MKFRDMSTLLAHKLVVMLALGWLWQAGTIHAADSPQPNFIVIMADDLGYGDLGVYGSSLIQTPNLDAMALRGARLDSFTPAPMSAPPPAAACSPGATRSGWGWSATWLVPVTMFISQPKKPRSPRHWVSWVTARLCLANGTWAAVWNGRPTAMASMSFSE